MYLGTMVTRRTKLAEYCERRAAEMQAERERAKEHEEAEARRKLTAQIEKAIRDAEVRKVKELVDRDFRARKIAIKAKERVTIDIIIDAVCLEFCVSSAALLSKRRTSDIMTPRLALYYLANKFTSVSMYEIGRKCGGRDHATIIHGVNLANERLQDEPAFAARVAKLEAIFCAKAVAE